MALQHRKDERHHREEKIYIEILSASDNESQDSILLECSTRDVSKNGLKILSSYPLIISSILELLISFESGGYKFLLTGEVKWLEKAPSDQYLAGFELIEAEHSDYIVWQRMFSEDISDSA